MYYYEFIKLEYTMATGLQVNLNLEKYSTGLDFSDKKAVLKYIMKCKENIIGVSNQ